MDGSNPEMPATAPAAWDLGAVYQVVGELLLSPAVREQERLEEALGRLPQAPLRGCIERFLESPAAHDVDEYTQTLELQPPCPLYLGAYIYEEPNSCRGAGACGRNGYMIELGALYEHYGFSLGNRELPDFLPVMTEFLAMSLERPERDGVGLRRRFVDKQVQPGLPPLRKKLQQYESVYDLVVEALEMALEEDLERMADDPIWVPPEVAVTIPQPSPGARATDITMTGMEQR
jgi:nitrate reductase delta subunit